MGVGEGPLINKDGLYESLQDKTEKYLKSLLKVEKVDVSIYEEAEYTACYGTIYGEKTEVVFEFKFSELPGCCAYVVSHTTHVHESYRALGIATFLQEIKVELAKGLGYTSILSTSIRSNLAQSKVLYNNGWDLIHTCTNKRTGNIVDTWVKPV